MKIVQEYLEHRIKGSRLVVESKERYKTEMMNYLENKSIFREDRQDQSEENGK